MTDLGLNNAPLAAVASVAVYVAQVTASVNPVLAFVLTLVFGKGLDIVCRYIYRGYVAAKRIRAESEAEEWRRRALAAEAQIATKGE